jgi:2-haloacid dehalogenase
MPYQSLLFDADDTLFDFEKAQTHALETSLSEFGVPFQANYSQSHFDFPLAMIRIVITQGEIQKLSIQW